MIIFTSVMILNFKTHFSTKHLSSVALSWTSNVWSEWICAWLTVHGQSSNYEIFHEPPARVNDLWHRLLIESGWTLGKLSSILFVKLIELLLLECLSRHRFTTTILRFIAKRAIYTSTNQSNRPQQTGIKTICL